jgi:hypothetical protein
MGPRQMKAGVYGYGTRKRLSFSLGQYTIIFQAEVYAIKASSIQNINRSYKNKNIYIVSDSQSVIKALAGTRLTLRKSRIASNP